MRKPCCCNKGACCHIDETCEITTQEKCEEQCGEFQGIDVPCLQCVSDSDCFDGNCINGECDNGVDCAYERGPCCFCESEFSDCVEDLTEPECSLGESSRTCVDGELVIEYEWEQGVWQGPDHTCEDSCDCNDGTGSCCVEGLCRDNYTFDQCTGSGHYYYGDGTSCFSNGFNVGSSLDGDGDLPAGTATDPLGSCCIITLDNAPYHTALCFHQSTQQGCESWCTDPSSQHYEDECNWYEVDFSCSCNCIGGSQEEDWCCFGTTSPPLNCGSCQDPPSGLYCLGSGEGGNEQLSVGTCQECGELGPCEEDSDCEENQCCVGGMCRVCGCSNDSECLGENMCCYGGDCMDCIPCEEFGACCVSNPNSSNVCMQNLTENECDESEGVFQGVNTTQCEDCEDEPEPTGACCIWSSAETYCIILSPKECCGLGGDYLGDDIACVDGGDTCGGAGGGCCCVFEYDPSVNLREVEACWNCSTSCFDASLSCIAMGGVFSSSPCEDTDNCLPMP